VRCLIYQFPMDEGALWSDQWPLFFAWILICVTRTLFFLLLSFITPLTLITILAMFMAFYVWEPFLLFKTWHHVVLTSCLQLWENLQILMKGHNYLSFFVYTSGALKTNRSLNSSILIISFLQYLCFFISSHCSLIKTIIIL